MYVIKRSLTRWPNTVTAYSGGAEMWFICVLRPTTQSVGEHNIALEILNEPRPRVMMMMTDYVLRDGG